MYGGCWIDGEEGAAEAQLTAEYSTGSEPLGRALVYPHGPWMPKNKKHCACWKVGQKSRPKRVVEMEGIECSL